MATYTAQMLVGEAHPNHGGLVPQSLAQLFLVENDVPTWTLQPGSRASEAVTWIPERPESILEDGLLMAACCVVKDDSVVALYQKHSSTRKPNVLNLGEEISADTLLAMREQCRKCSFGPSPRWKIVLSCFYGSTVIDQLSVVEKYGFDCEILTPTFTRLYSRWQDEVTVSGSLTKNHEG